MLTMVKSEFAGSSIVEAPMRVIIPHRVAGAVPGRNFTAMLPRRYGRPFDRFVRSVGYGRGGRGRSASRRPVSIPGDAISEINGRNPAAGLALAVTVPMATVMTART